MKRLPHPRGPITEVLLDALARGRAAPPPPESDVSRSEDDDRQLALALCYDLHFRGLPGVDDRREWDPGLIAFRCALEDVWEEELRAEIGPIAPPPRPSDVSHAIVALSDEERAPSLSRYLARRAGLAEFREFVIHRSIYTLREADPHSFAIPRLGGAAKSALLEIQGR